MKDSHRDGHPKILELVNPLNAEVTQSNIEIGGEGTIALVRQKHELGFPDIEGQMVSVCPQL
jgi:hypothetical protein